MRSAVLGTRGRQVDHALVEVDLRPAQGGDFIPALAGEDQQADDTGMGMAKLASR